MVIILALLIFAWLVAVVAAFLWRLLLSFFKSAR